jgi:hypothetical protein
VLFGPLVLVPVELTRLGTSALTAGPVLSALPVGFALAATAADRLLPPGWSDLRRSRVGAAGCGLRRGPGPARHAAAAAAALVPLGVMRTSRAT